MIKSFWKFGIGIVCLMFVSLFLLPEQDTSTISQPIHNNRSFSAIDDLSQAVVGDIWVSEPVEPSISPPITELPTYEPTYYLDREINPRLNLSGLTEADSAYQGGILGGVDPLLIQQEKSPAATDVAFLTPILNYAGQGFSGVNPPDTVGDVGPNHYIQLINGGGGALMRIYDKAGNTLAGPTALDSLGTGACASGLGDGIVLYDQSADRWMVSEFSDIANAICVYISQGSNPVTSSWYVYQFNTPNFPDYPKYGVWSDAYYVSTNESSPAVYALDRTKMLAGLAATSQRFTAPNLAGFGFQALTPSDLDGATAPPAGAPNYFMRHRDDEAHNSGSNNPTQDYVEIWPFHVDFGNPGNSTFTGPINIPIAEFDSELCGFFSFSCFPQQGSSTKLDPLREVIMPRLQYRNFGAYETLVGNFVTDVDGTDHGGVRWFELRKSGAGSWSLYQEGTYAPDASSRWMGAISMDGAGNIAVGYNVTSSSMYPSIRYTGRLASDPLGTMPQGEGTLINGSGANGSIRYGDYSAMSVDPVDDCTFWFTGEYNASSTWSTRIGTFKFDACDGGGGDFTVSATPPELAVCSGSEAIYSVTVGQIGGYTDNVTLSSSGEPAGTTTSFSPNPVTPPGSSQFKVSNIGAGAGGNHTLDIIGNSTAGTHMTQVDLDVYTAVPTAPTLTNPTNNATNVPLTPTFNWTAVAQANAYSIQIATDVGFTNIIDSASNLDATTYTVGAALNMQTTYYWRVRADNPCGAGTNSATYNFTTGGTTAPDISVDPMTIISHQAPNTQTTHSMDINNLGSAPLVWQINETNDPTATPAYASNVVTNQIARQGTAVAANPGILEKLSPTRDVTAINDGGFEAGPFGGSWNETSTNFGTPICDVDSCGTGTGTGPHSGTYWAWFGGVDAYEEGAVSQNATIPAESNTLTFWLEQIACDSAADYLELLIDGNQVFYSDGSSALCGNLGYTQQSVDISAYADGGVHTIAFHSEIFATNGGGSNFFVDDVALASGGPATGCDSPSNIPWASVSPASGTTMPAGSSTVDVTFNSNGLPEGNYSGTLCVESNDPAEPRVEVTLQLQVGNSAYTVYLPIIFN